MKSITSSDGRGADRVLDDDGTELDGFIVVDPDEDADGDPSGDAIEQILLELTDDVDPSL